MVVPGQQTSQLFPQNWKPVAIALSIHTFHLFNNVWRNMSEIKTVHYESIILYVQLSKMIIHQTKTCFSYEIWSHFLLDPHLILLMNPNLTHTSLYGQIKDAVQKPKFFLGQLKNFLNLFIHSSKRNLK